MLLKLLEKLGRKRIIMDRRGAEPYLERYYIFLKDRKSFPFNIFIHKFLKGDPADPHDHPWPYATLIFSGGYMEWIPQFGEDGTKSTEICKWRGPGHFRICSANSYHRIELKPGITPWTLFIPGPQIREWGFFVKNKWIPHGDYIEGEKL
jgi:hypothetical protein